MFHISEIKKVFEITDIILITHYHFLMLTYMLYFFSSFSLKARRALDLSTLPVAHPSWLLG